MSTHSIHRDWRSRCKTSLRADYESSSILLSITVEQQEINHKTLLFSSSAGLHTKKRRWWHKSMRVHLASGLYWAGRVCTTARLSWRKWRMQLVVGRSRLRRLRGGGFERKPVDVDSCWGRRALEFSFGVISVTSTYMRSTSAR